MVMTRRINLLFLLTAIALMFVGGCASGPPLSPIDPELLAEYRALPLSGDETGIVAPKVIRRVDPKMPAEFVGSGQARSAALEAAVGADGKVLAVWYVSGDRQWARVVADALRRWEFEPATRDGEPVAVRFKMTSNFRSNPVR